MDLNNLPPRWVVDAELARQKLREYVKQSWHVIEPAQPFVPGWHIDAICDHLEAVSRGQIRKLVINMPPRMSKSSVVAVAWPTWEWISMPWTRWMFGSYKESLSIRDSVRCRRIIMSPWYQRNWGADSYWAYTNKDKVYTLVGDQNEKMKFENNRTGYRIATSVDGGLGDGANRLVLDDPHSVDEAESPVQRKHTTDWWSGTWSTRMNDPKLDAEVIVMQRLHEDDISGLALKQGGWEHLCLPEEYDGKDLVAA